jgi:hypothetical protein
VTTFKIGAYSSEFCIAETVLVTTIAPQVASASLLFLPSGGKTHTKILPPPRDDAQSSTFFWKEVSAAGNIPTGGTILFFCLAWHLA